MSDQPSESVLKTPFRPGLFDGRVALVTGGGTGIGRAIAEELGGLGAKIAICGRRQEPLDECAAALRAKGIAVFAATCDIRDADAVSNYVAAVLAHFGRIDVLVNNAGGQFPSPAAVMKPKGFDAVVRNNLVGTFNVTHAVANQWMIPQKSGRIVNIIANVLRGFPGMAHTGAARAGVENLTKSLAVEWAPFNIQVTAVAPGTILSTGTDRYPPELVVKAKQQTPARRLGVPEEVSHTVAFLASDAADYITGTTLYIDGGASLWGDIWDVVS
ncbi:MAG: SDR family oxidoreductase [Myxococcales bacterium]|nr:SDR family oxidoreductase [Myxococcales bacterium]